MAGGAGTFTVKLAPLAPYNGSDPKLSRMSIDKSFQGDLEGTSQGEMLAAMSEVKGSAGYVAIEKVSGVLAGRRGSFVLQHSSTMTRGAPTQSIMVVPDSATVELAGLEGRMTITIVDKEHRYQFEYTLPGR